MTSRFLAFMLAVMSLIHASTTQSPPHNWLIAQQEANQLLFQLITSKQPRPATPWASPLKSSLKTAKSSPRGLLGSSPTTGGIRIHSPGVLAFEHLMLSEVDNQLVISNDTTVTGALNTATLNTGQGNNELYPMNQDMSTNASVQFATADVGMYMLSLFN